MVFGKPTSPIALTPKELDGTKVDQAADDSKHYCDVFDPRAKKWMMLQAAEILK